MRPFPSCTRPTRRVTFRVMKAPSLHFLLALLVIGLTGSIENSAADSWPQPRTGGTPYRIVDMVGSADDIKVEFVVENDTSGEVAKFIVHNYGKVPIEFNGSADEYYYVLLDGSRYRIAPLQGDCPYYYQCDQVLNPLHFTEVPIGGRHVSKIVGSVVFMEEEYRKNRGKISHMLVVLDFGRVVVQLSPTGEKLP